VAAGGRAPAPAVLAGQQRLAALDVLQQALAIQPRQQRQFRARFTLLRLQEGNLPAITEHRHQIKPPAFRQQRQLALQIGHFCAYRFSQQRQGGAGVGQLQLLAGQVVGGDGQIFRVGQVGLRQLAIDLYRFLRGGQPFLTAAKVGVTDAQVVQGYGQKPACFWLAALQLPQDPNPFLGWCQCLLLLPNCVEESPQVDECPRPIYIQGRSIRLRPRQHLPL